MTVGRRRLIRRAALVILVVVAIAFGGFLWWSRPQPLLPEATAALASTSAAAFTAGPGGRLTFSPTADPPDTGLVLYTGGKVPPAAYAPAARSIAEAGYLVVLVPAPLDFAIFDTGAAAPVVADHPEIQAWAVGGHSLGGASAAIYAESQPGSVDGLVLWASFSSVDLSHDGLRVALVYGSLDAGAASFTASDAVARLGSDVTVTIVDGGNHEQMGWYTGQPNDPPATIARVAQQDQVVAATIALLASIDPD